MLTQVTPLERRAVTALLACLRGQEWDAAHLMNELGDMDKLKVRDACDALATLSLPVVDTGGRTPSPRKRSQR
jgi:hypothetical protein